MARILRRPRAVLDLLELWNYVAERADSERADAVLSRLYDTLNTLADNPLMGRQRDELLPGLRSHPTSRYLVFYFPVPDGIDLVRVLYGGRDIAAALIDEAL